MEHAERDTEREAQSLHECFMLHASCFVLDPLFGLFVQYVLLAPFAELFEFQAILQCLLVLLRIIINVLALGAL